MQLAESIYQLSNRLPQHELYGLTSQLRRAAVSIPSNIAEGSQRGSDRDFANFILIAKGSLAEVQTQLLLAVRCRYLSDADVQQILSSTEELHRMLYAFHSKLAARSS